VLPLGHDQYEDGAKDEFASSDASRGRFQKPGATGYVDCFGDRAGPPGQGW